MDRMNRPSVIPELFFDLYARVIPGIILLIGLIVVIPSSQIMAMSALRDHRILPPSYITINLALVVSYIAGVWLQIVSEAISKIWLGHGLATMGVYNCAEKCQHGHLDWKQQHS